MKVAASGLSKPQDPQNAQRMKDLLAWMKKLAALKDPKKGVEHDRTR